MTVFEFDSSGPDITDRPDRAASAEQADDDEGNGKISEEYDQARPEPFPFSVFLRFTGACLLHGIVFLHRCCRLGACRTLSGEQPVHFLYPINNLSHELGIVKHDFLLFRIIYEIKNKERTQTRPRFAGGASRLGKFASARTSLTCRETRKQRYFGNTQEAENSLPLAQLCFTARRENKGTLEILRKRKARLRSLIFS